MARIPLLALLVALAACTDDAGPPVALPDRGDATGTPDDAPMTFEDSAAVLQAQVDSLRAAVAGTQRRVDEGFREADSLRARVDATARDIEAARERAEAVDAETDALLGQ